MPIERSGQTNCPDGNSSTQCQVHIINSSSRSGSQLPHREALVGKQTAQRRDQNLLQSLVTSPYKASGSSTWSLQDLFLAAQKMGWIPIVQLCRNNDSETSLTFFQGQRQKFFPKECNVPSALKGTFSILYRVVKR